MAGVKSFLSSRAIRSLGEISGQSVPAGSDLQIQFNNAGTLAGASQLLWNSATQTLLFTSSGNISMPGGSSSAPAILGSSAGIYFSGNAVFFSNPGGGVDFFEASIDRVATRSGLQYSWSASSTDLTTFDTGLARAAAGIVTITDGSTGSGSLRLRDTSGSNHFTLSPGNHTADRTVTITSNTDNTDFALSSGSFSFSAPLVVGTFAAETAGSATAELRVINASAPCEIHTEHGTSTGYSGFGARNDLLQNGSGVTRAGVALVAHGSASASTLFGRSAASVASLLSAGADGNGLCIGAGTSGKPLWFGTLNQDGTAECKAYFRASYKTLTDASTTSFMKLTVPAGAVAAGKFDWAVYCIAAAAHQIRSGTAWYNVFNRTGTETVQIINTVVNLANLESGTLTVTFSSINTGTNEIEFQINADTSLTPVLLAAQFTFYPVAGAGTFTDM